MLPKIRTWNMPCLSNIGPKKKTTSEKAKIVRFEISENISSCSWHAWTVWLRVSRLATWRSSSHKSLKTPSATKISFNVLILYTLSSSVYLPGPWWAAHQPWVGTILWFRHLVCVWQSADADCLISIEHNSDYLNDVSNEWEVLVGQK